jgi:hypothetical protein
MAQPNSKKWLISLYSALLFIVIASPFVYGLVNSVTSLIGINIASESGCPNALGLIIHSVVFLLIVRISMGDLALPWQ